MGQRMVRLFSFGCCLCVSSQASADDDKVLGGPGARTCGEFAFDYRVNRNTEYTYFDWAEGFISGMNWIDAAPSQRPLLLTPHSPSVPGPRLFLPRRIAYLGTAATPLS
jgi:hypothetical protein